MRAGGGSRGGGGGGSRAVIRVMVIKILMVTIVGDGGAYGDYMVKYCLRW